MERHVRGIGYAIIKCNVLAAFLTTVAIVKTILFPFLLWLREVGRGRSRFFATGAFKAQVFERCTHHKDRGNRSFEIPQCGRLT